MLAMLGVSSPCAAVKFHIVEQGVPGEAPVAEDEAERRGLPDIVIHNGEGWCLLIESKVKAGLTADQLHRHERTLRKRGFEQIHVLALTTAGVTVPGGAIGLTWCGLYEWLAGAWTAMEPLFGVLRGKN